MIKKHLPKSRIVFETRLTRLFEEPRASESGDQIDQEDTPARAGFLDIFEELGLCFWGSKGLGIRVFGFKVLYRVWWVYVSC